MISGGVATVYVSDMDNAVRFYTQVLGLMLTFRFGNHWATVRAGSSLVIGLHPWSTKYPKPGTPGSVQIGLFASGFESMMALAARLRQDGVKVSDVIRSEEANYIQFTDPDDNPIYVGDRDPAVDEAPQSIDAAGLATRR